MKRLRTARAMALQPDLSVTVAGLVLKNPVIAASGTFGYGTEYRNLARAADFGAIVIKTITLLPRAGNRPPRLCETAAGMLNAIGLANVGLERFIGQKLPKLAGSRTVIVANIAGSTIDEYVELAGRLNDQPAVSALEINISCPNVKEGGIAFGSDPRTAERLTRRVRRVFGRPLWVKLSPNVTDIAQIARAVEAAGADALSLINTLWGMAIDPESQRPVLGNVTGGLSGPAIKPMALFNVHRVRPAVKIPIIGLGGIMTAGDAVEFMLAGASAVQVGTATFADPGTAKHIVVGLRQYCVRHGIASVSQLCGALRT